MVYFRTATIMLMNSKWVSSITSIISSLLAVDIYLPRHSQIIPTSNIYGVTAGMGIKYDLGGTMLKLDYAFRQTKFFDSNHVICCSIWFLKSYSIIFFKNPDNSRGFFC